MPQYEVELDGKRYILEGDAPPSEEEARQSVQSAQPASPLSTLMASVGRGYENVFTRPEAAVRGAIQSPFHPLQGFQRGSVAPESVPTFQSQALNAYYNRLRPGESPNFATVLGGMVPSAAGLAADVATSPANLILGLLPGLGGVRRAGQAIAESRPGQALGEFLTKQRSLPRLPLSRQATVKTLQEIRQAFLQAPKIASTEWEAAMAEVDRLHPDLKVDASDPFVRLKVSGQENTSVLSGLHRAARRVGRAEKKTGISELLTRVLENPAEAQSLTRQEVANLKSVFQEALKPQFNRFVPELDDTELELMEAYHGLRHAQIDQVPGYEDIAKQYGDTLEKFRALKPKFKMGALYNNILGDFRDPELATIAEQLLPHDAIGMMNQLRMARNVKRGAGIAGIAAAGVLTTKTPLGRAFLELVGLRSRE